jgi:hypothetical protein
VSRSLIPVLTPHSSLRLDQAEDEFSWRTGSVNGSRRASREVPYARRSKSLEVLIPVLYLKGISTGDFEEALAATALPRGNQIRSRRSHALSRPS